MVLEALLHKNRMAVGEIKGTILSSNGTIPVIINNLEKSEMVRRVTDPTDHRKSLVELTDKGRNLIEKIRPENDRMYQERFSVWTSDEKKELVRLIALYESGLKARQENNNENQ
jgi:MarR family 2-MHQ and catechol resistance regulon transcriptional repressor